MCVGGGAELIAYEILCVDNTPSFVVLMSVAVEDDDFFNNHPLSGD